MPAFSGGGRLRLRLSRRVGRIGNGAAAADGMSRLPGRPRLQGARAGVRTGAIAATGRGGRRRFHGPRVLRGGFLRNHRDELLLAGLELLDAGLELFDLAAGAGQVARHRLERVRLISRGGGWRGGSDRRCSRSNFRWSRRSSSLRCGRRLGRGLSRRSIRRVDVGGSRSRLRGEPGFFRRLR